MTAAWMTGFTWGQFDKSHLQIIIQQSYFNTSNN